jgi:hypothetical protein
MATGIYSWSQTAASNATADSTIDWAEGQAPSTVNDSARAMMAIMSIWRDDISGVQPSNVVQTSGGTANAQTLTTNGSIASLTNGWTLTFKAGATNTGACTLAVDGLTAKNIQVISGTSVAGGEILTGCVYTVTYHQPADAWVLHHGIPYATQAQMELGTNTTALIVPARVQHHPGVAKAWGYVTVSGGTPTLVTSHNITSIADGGTGVLNVTIATDMSSASYAILCSAEHDNAVESICRIDSQAAGSFVLRNVNTSGTEVDPPAWHFVVYGDQA